MKLSNKLVEDLVKELVGDDAIKLVDLIRGKKKC